MAFKKRTTRPVHISCFGGLKVCIYGRGIHVQGWKSPKVYQLLALIVAMGGKNIAAYQLCDAIWPDGEGDKGMQNLEFILRRLRQGDQSIPAMHACQSDWLSRCCNWLDATVMHWRNDGSAADQRALWHASIGAGCGAG